MTEPLYAGPRCGHHPHLPEPALTAGCEPVTFDPEISAPEGGRRLKSARQAPDQWRYVSPHTATTAVSSTEWERVALPLPLAVVFLRSK
jgi:hypothetical protein